MTPRQLLRLYPRQWRRRYGDEFLAVVENTTIDGRVIRDVLRAAAGEWIFETLTGRIVLALIVTTIASAIAQWLRASIPTSAGIELLADGTRLVSPAWPVSFGVVAATLQLMFYLRSIVAFFPRRLTRMTRPELVLWMVLFGIASAASQWGDLVLWDATGVTPDSPFEIWRRHALQLSSALMMNCLFAAMFNPRYEPRMPPRPGSPPARPLGLTR